MKGEAEEKERLPGKAAGWLVLLMKEVELRMPVWFDCGLVE